MWFAHNQTPCGSMKNSEMDLNKLPNTGLYSVLIFRLENYWNMAQTAFLLNQDMSSHECKRSKMHITKHAPLVPVFVDEYSLSRCVSLIHVMNYGGIQQANKWSMVTQKESIALIGTHFKCKMTNQRNEVRRRFRS